MFRLLSSCDQVLYTVTFTQFAMKRASARQAATSSKKLKSEASSSESAFNVSWSEYGDSGPKGLRPVLVLDGPDVKPSSKVIGFDMDSTLIVQASGRKFPVGPKDWKFWSGKVVPKLKELFDDGNKIVIFSNQLGIEKAKTKKSDIETKILDIMGRLGFPVQAFISTAESNFRKPSPAMWALMEEKYNGGVAVDRSLCMYVGDAAGRPKGWALGKPKDFSCGDRKFAANLGVKFMTPEELFDGAKPYPKFEWGSIDPKTILADASKNKMDLSSLPSKSLEMIILVGRPASGKSTFSKRYLEKDYTIVNRDTLKTQEKCLKTAAESLGNKRSVVVDNTNPSKEVRKTYIEVARKAGVPVRCFYFDLPVEVAKHMNMYRQAISKGKQRRVPDVGYNMFKSQFHEPSTAEGFLDVVKIGFVPCFADDREKEVFQHWT